MNIAHAQEEVSHRRRLKTAADAHRFALAGKSTFTLVSTATRARFTFKVKQSETRDLFFVSVLTGSDNNNSYTYLGTLRHGYAPDTQWHWKHGKKSRIGADAPSAKAFAWIWSNLNQDSLPETVEFWHEGRCCRCNRKLTVPASIEAGIGPECASLMGVRLEIPAQ